MKLIAIATLFLLALVLAIVSSTFAELGLRWSAVTLALCGLAAMALMFLLLWRPDWFE